MPLMTDWLSPGPVSSGVNVSGLSYEPGTDEMLGGPGRKERGISIFAGYNLLAIALNIEFDESVEACLSTNHEYS